MYQVTKRDGTAARFEIGKISAAITKAFQALDKQFHPSVIDLLALRVTADFEPKIRDGRIAVEDIQDSVETVLSEAGYADVAKAYILYRKQREKVRNVNSTLLNYKDLVDDYLQINDWRVKENSTVTYSVGGLILSNSGAITANYWLSEIYDQEVANAHRNAEIHIHDLSMLTGYCAGWSLKQLIQEGLGGIPGKITSAPASHLSTLCNQMVNFLGIMQNEWAGAQAFSSFDTYLAPFVKVDHLSQKEVKQCIQSFVYGVNTPSRWGTQAPFSNITLDWTVPKDLKDLPAIVGGKEMDFTYGDCKQEMDMVNKAFIEIMIEGDANGRGFQYPIPTYSITRDFDWSETENNKLLFEMTAKYGTPYFSNYINSDMEPSDVRSMCCRLRLDLRELRKKSGGFFGSGESTGSVGVVTINLPRIAYLAKDEADFYQRLDKLMDISARSLKTKRTVITKLLDAGLYPYTKRYLGNFDNHFSTIGLIGMNEVGLNAAWLRADLTQEKTQAFAKDVLNHMRERLSDYQEQYGDLYNLEATPAESTTYRFAKHDKAEFPGIITANENGTPYYTNSSHLPVGYTEDIFSALDVQDELQTLYTSGTVFHLLAGGGRPGAEDRRELQAALLHHVPHLLRVRRPRLSVRGAVHLPHLRPYHRGVQPDHRLLPPGAELERRQDPGVQGPEGVRHLRLPTAESRAGGGPGHRAGGAVRGGGGDGADALYHPHLPQLPPGGEPAAKGGHPLPQGGGGGVPGVDHPVWRPSGPHFGTGGRGPAGEDHRAGAHQKIRGETARPGGGVSPLAG